MEDTEDRRLSSIVTTVAWRLGFTELKPCQQSAVKSFVLGQDLFLSLPTGYGKSFCFTPGSAELFS